MPFFTTHEETGTGVEPNTRHKPPCIRLAYHSRYSRRAKKPKSPEPNILSRPHTPKPTEMESPTTEKHSRLTCLFHNTRGKPGLGVEPNICHGAPCTRLAYHSRYSRHA